MPRYTYICEDCEATLNVIHLMKEKLSECSECGSISIKKIPSQLASKIIKKTNEITIIRIGNLMGKVGVFAFGIVNIVVIKIILLMLVGFFVSGICSLTLALSVSLRSDRAGSVVGFIVAGIYMSGLVFQPLLGFVAEHISEGFVIYIVLTGLVVSLILNFVLFRLLNKKQSTKLILFAGSRA